MTKATKILSLALVSSIALTSAISCSGSGGGGGSSGGLSSLGGSLSAMIPGTGGKSGIQPNQLVEGTMNLGSALTMDDVAEDNLGQSVAVAATNRWPLFDK